MQAVLGKVAESAKMSSADHGKAAEGTNLSCRNRMQDQKVRILAGQKSDLELIRDQISQIRHQFVPAKTLNWLQARRIAK